MHSRSGVRALSSSGLGFHEGDQAALGTRCKQYDKLLKLNRNTHFWRARLGGVLTSRLRGKISRILLDLVSDDFYIPLKW